MGWWIIEAISGYGLYASRNARYWSSTSLRMRMRRRSHNRWYLRAAQLPVSRVGSPSDVGWGSSFGAFTNRNPLVFWGGADPIVFMHWIRKMIQIFHSGDFTESENVTMRFWSRMASPFRGGSRCTRLLMRKLSIPWSRRSLAGRYMSTFALLDA